MSPLSSRGEVVKSWMRNARSAHLLRGIKQITRDYETAISSNESIFKSLASREELIEWMWREVN